VKAKKAKATLTDAEWAQVFAARCKSKQGQPVSAEERRLLDIAFENYPERYRAMEREVFNATVPFGSSARWGDEARRTRSSSRSAVDHAERAPMSDVQREKAEAEAFAKERGFAFYIFRGTRYEYRGWKSEDRQATDEEIEMWTALGGPHAG
jgi:hypothetical protein